MKKLLLLAVLFIGATTVAQKIDAYQIIIHLKFGVSSVASFIIYNSRPIMLA